MATRSAVDTMTSVDPFSPPRRHRNSSIPSNTYTIETRNLTKRFGDDVAVDGLDLTVEPGTGYGFLGSNGAGKSTTMRMLTTLTVLATALTGLLSPHPLPIVATLVTSALLLTAGAGAIAAGIGATLPRFDAVRVSRSTKAIVPSTLAVVLYSVIVIGVSFPALIAHSAAFGHAIAPLLGISEPAVAAVGTGVSGVVTAGVGAVSAAYAVRVVDDYRL